MRKVKPAKRRTTARRWLRGAAAGLSIVTNGTTEATFIAPHGVSAVFAAHLPATEVRELHLNALGTSLDMVVHTPDRASGEHCEQQVLFEIERLSKLLSTYDSESGVSRWMKGIGDSSPELMYLLDQYHKWQDCTGGAIHVNLAAVKALWTAAEATRVTPPAGMLRDAFNTPMSLNIDALGKALIIEKAVAIARRTAPAGLLDIGGDIRVWGDHSWVIHVADPFNSADNAPALTQLTLREAAVATSGAYDRFMTIAGRRYSHIIDPRTLCPAKVERSATIIAADCVSANALSTAACVLDLEEAAALADSYSSGYLITDGDRVRSAGVPASRPAQRGAAQTMPSSAPAQTRPAPVPLSHQWPDGYQALVEVSLKSAMTFKYKRPYVAIWIENEKKEEVRSLSIWGTKAKYLPELSTWWAAIGGDQNRMRNVTRATRPAGRYTLIWDGRDDSGRRVPQGKYNFWIEINREHGRHTRQFVSLICGDKLSSVKVPATAESNESRIEYRRVQEK